MIPPELLQPAELRELTGRVQRAAWRRWLDRVGVAYIETPSGYPLVYRDRLNRSKVAINAEPAINLDALRATRRQTA